MYTCPVSSSIVRPVLFSIRTRRACWCPDHGPPRHSRPLCTTYPYLIPEHYFNAPPQCSCMACRHKEQRRASGRMKPACGSLAAIGISRDSPLKGVSCCVLENTSNHAILTCRLCNRVTSPFPGAPKHTTPVVRWLQHVKRGHLRRAGPVST